MTEHILFLIQKPMEKSYWLFVEGTSFMLTADPPTKRRHSSPTLYYPDYFPDPLRELVKARASFKQTSPVTRHVAICDKCRQEQMRPPSWNGIFDVIPHTVGSHRAVEPFCA